MSAEFQLNEIYTIKLTSGEEIVAKVVDHSEGWLRINSPVAVSPSPQGMALMPAMFTADAANPPRLNISNVTFYALTDSNVRARYVEATTGIKVPEKKLVLG